MKELKITLLGILLLLTSTAFGQSEAFIEQKQKKLSVKSPFEKIVDREIPAIIEYEDEKIIAFIPLRKQAPVHILIVPKKRIPTVNDLTSVDALIIGEMFLVARTLAQKNGIADSGYRLSLNTNEDAGQSVFHLHMHLLGGKELGPITTQDFIDKR